MKDLLDKLSSYNLFNYLLPGVILAILVEEFTTIRLVRLDIITGVFFYYFLGSVVSRIGSLVVEPVLLKVRIIDYSSYTDYVRESKSDSKLELLSEQNNMYRKFVSVILVVGFVWIYGKGTLILPLLKDATPFLCITLLCLLYLFSYRKQTAYISKRVQASNVYSTDTSQETVSERRKSVESSSRS